MSSSTSMEQRLGKKFMDASAIVIYALFTLHLAILPFWMSLARLVSKMTQDDGFYYLKVARYIATEGRMTFDGIHWTNGFHPLWGWLLAAVILPFRNAGTESIFRICFFVNVLVLVAAGFFFCRAWRHLFRSTWILGLPVFAGAYFFNSYFLLESSLVLLVLALCLEWFMRFSVSDRAPSIWAWAVFGVLLAALGLARLDMVFAGFFLFLFATLRQPRIGRAYSFWIGPIIAATVAFIILMIWAGWTKWTSGHWGTISGSLKMDLMHPLWHGDRLRWLLGSIRLLSLCGSFMILAWWLLSVCVPGKISSKMRFTGLDALVILAGGNVAHLIFQTLFVSWAVFGWSVATYSLFFVAAFICIMGYLAKMRWQVLARSFTLLGLLFAAYYGMMHFKSLRAPLDSDNSWTDDALKAAQWVSKSLPPDAVLALSDAGVFAYFSERRVVNLDGLVNNWEYQDYLARNEFDRFLKESGVRYFVCHALPADKVNHYAYAAYSHRYKKTCSPLDLISEKIIYKELTVIPNVATTYFTIWKL